MHCELTPDPARFLALAGPFLASRPVEHNVLLTAAARARTGGEPCRSGWVRDGDRVVGAVVQSPDTHRAALSPMPAEAVPVVVERLAEDGPDLAGIEGEAATAARFAGTWASARRVAVHPVEARRLYRLGDLLIPEGVPGRLRPAGQDDVGLLLDWRAASDWEQGVDPASATAPERTRRRIDDGEGWLWEVDGEPVATTFATPPVAGASRLRFVYTPPGHRRRGYAGACVAALSARLRATGTPHCLLYTRLANPTSNAVYQRLGYEPVGEVLVFRFAL